jgi:DNA-directed RNA polymerase subunit alpha
MVVYYLNKVSEKLTDYRYPIKEGDICMLYDGDAVKTIYVDSETETDSIWRDFKFIDSKSLKSYHLPKTDSVLCAPVGDKHAIGDTALLTQLIQECKGEWLLDFLNETSAVLSGFVDYWDLMVLRRLTGDDDIEIAYGDEEALSAFIDKPDEDDEDEELEDEYEEE